MTTADDTDTVNMNTVYVHISGGETAAYRVRYLLQLQQRQWTRAYQGRHCRLQHASAVSEARQRQGLANQAPLFEATPPESYSTVHANNPGALGQCA